MTGYIYVITNDINGKQYVGQTTDTLKNRFSDHCKDSNLARCKGRPLYLAMNKYGKEHFSIKEIEECSFEQLDEREQYWIQKLDTYKHGYNATLGGEGTQVYNYDLFIEDFNNGMNLKQIAEKYQCGPDTVGKALRKAGLNTRRANMTTSQTNAIPIYQYDLEGNFIQKFSSHWAAAKQIINEKSLDISIINHVRTNISCAAQNAHYRKSAYGYQWNTELKEMSQIEYKSQGIPVQCIETNEIFPNATQAAKWCGLKTQTSILDYLHKRNGRKSAGKHPITGEKLHWQYAEENNNAPN